MLQNAPPCGRGASFNRFQLLLRHFRLLRTGKSFDDPFEKISGSLLITQFQEGPGLFE